MLISILEDYYQTRGLKMPTFDDAIKFLYTELAEVHELDLADRGYVRNNPQNKPKYSDEQMASELGDALQMIIVAGMTKGLDPMTALIDKLSGKSGRNYHSWIADEGL